MLLQYYIWRGGDSVFKVVSTPLPAISRHLPKNSVFGHLPPFAPAYGRPLDPTTPFINKNVITGCCCNNLYGKKENPGCFYPFVPLSPTICLKNQFLAIYPHLRLLMGNPLTLPPLLLTKMSSLDIVAIIYTDRKGFQADSTPLSRHLPPFAWKFNFWPFTPICACLRATLWPHLHFYWQKCYYWMILQQYIQRES